MQLYLLARGKLSVENFGRQLLSIHRGHRRDRPSCSFEGMLALPAPALARPASSSIRPSVAGWCTIPLIIISQGFLGAITVHGDLLPARAPLAQRATGAGHRRASVLPRVRPQRGGGDGRLQGRRAASPPRSAA
ncbi:MAG: hypothetical protein MZU95_15815 [Desulfomicrobium escambiense]|nr:hypothetical protein [Desulfomicrobium escambiense]